MQEYRLNIKLTAVSVGPASSMMKTPSVVILSPSRDDVRSVQPSETENQCRNIQIELNHDLKIKSHIEL